jgi:glycosyltransferase involved in cell wall biosynthesis
MPKITVIVAVYNRQETLAECLDSIFSQTYCEIEVIVIDGGSTDGSVDIIHGYEEKISYWITEPDTGIYDAWNKALPHVTGEWVCFVGSDDYFRDVDVLSKIAWELETISSVTDFAYSRVMRVNQNGLDLFEEGTPWEIARKSLGRGMTVPHPAMMHRNRVFTEGGYFDPEFRIAGDYELFLRECRQDNVVFLSAVCAISMRQGGISSQYGNYRISLLECRRAQKRYGQRLASPSWVADLALSDARFLMFKLLGDKITKRAIDSARKVFGRPPYWTRL